MDLQLALGFDVDEDGLLEEGADPLARGEDEWLFNTGEEIAILTGTPGFLRITLLGRGPQADRGYRAPLLVDLEDRSYEGHAYNTDDVERSYHRMALQTIAELRNL